MQPRIKLCELSVPNLQLDSLLGGEQCEISITSNNLKQIQISVRVCILFTLEPSCTCITMKVPHSFLNLFQTGSQIHNYLTRYAELHNPQVQRTNIKQFKILYQGPKLWNSLPYSIIELNNIRSFKQLLKSYLINYEDFFRLHSELSDSSGRVTPEHSGLRETLNEFARELRRFAALPFDINKHLNICRQNISPLQGTKFVETQEQNYDVTLVQQPFETLHRP
ncbi:hypothetical protein pdam_00020033 [Pocillopora damicornis]|uniref:Uncharacterized protein n=1 Tax=Pocillopora damicornis TaxID=46731 RepID=A0A3M6T8T1_POCDA|nr:hypothetical protein pdam_00020033 [Pocillopora damicornis]